MEERRRERLCDGWKRGSGPRGREAAERVMMNMDLKGVLGEGREAEGKPGVREKRRHGEQEGGRGVRRNVCVGGD